MFNKRASKTLNLNFDNAKKDEQQQQRPPSEGV